MRSPMDEASFMNFYANTVLGYSKIMQRKICKSLEDAHLITREAQRSMSESENTLFFDREDTLETIVGTTAKNIHFSAFYEKLEFTKLYKYSVPFFFEQSEGKEVKAAIAEADASAFDEDSFQPDYILDESVKEARPLYWINDDSIMLKFVLQKNYYLPETSDRVEYRYPVVVYIADGFLEIRYDAMKYVDTINIVSLDEYEKVVSECIIWLEKELCLTLYLCDHQHIISVINDRENTNVVMYKQMMEMSSGGAAELTASENADCLLPFVGELRELIVENEELFNQHEEVKALLVQYLDDKEATASYPYIYIKWKKPVITNSFVVKVTFDYLKNKYTLLQHNTGECKDLGMERMNDAIRYLCTSGSFVRGDKN